MSANTPTQLRDWFERVPMLPAGRVLDLGPTLVVAPHPDDEVLGCGGVIALLRTAGLPVRVMVTSDGAASHPGSKAYPPAVLARLRRAESEAGLKLLGVQPDEVTFLALPDGAVPMPQSPAGSRAVDRARAAINRWSGLQTILLPWRRDPHDDHRATWALFSAALDETRAPVRRLEYPIWSRVHPGPDDLPREGEAACWRLDIAGVGSVKRAAILAHRSQTSSLIDDAEIGECLTPEVLARFYQLWEPFIEVGAATSDSRNAVRRDEGSS
ncbi:MAG: PIG-L deacetylase family protein [Chloroflexota bacterium]